jgi:serine/threonine-protein kinase
MGTVVLAHDLTLDRKVAIKLLAGELCLDDEAVVRFEREARLTAKLEHPNIVPVFAVGRHGRRPFIVMKFLDGMPLSAYMRITPLPLPEAEVLSIMRQLCEGVSLVHANGFVHRDIKPANIFIGPTGLATLLDFGILKDVGHSLTGIGIVMGTPAYLAPEMLRGDPIDHRADLFALGVVLYELLSGVRPYLAPTLEAAQLQMKERAPDIKIRAPWVPPAVAQVVTRAIERDPGRRFQSARDLWLALDAAFKPGDAPGVAAHRSRSSRRWVVWAGAGTGLLAAGIAAALWRGAETPLPPAPPPLAAVSPLQVAPEPKPAPPPPPEARAPAPVSMKDAPVAKRTSHPAAPKASHARAPERMAEAPADGTLRVVTLDSGESTWATLEIDGVPRGGTPVAVELPPGRHHLRIAREGFRPIDREVEVGSGQQSVLRIDLAP